MSPPIKVLAREAYLVPSKKVPETVADEMKRIGLLRFYDEKACQKCEYFPDRHSDVCDACPAFQGGTQLVKDIVVKGSKYLSIPIGNKRLLERLATEVGRDMRVIPMFKSRPMSKKISFTGKLLGYQKPASKVVRREKRGVLKSKPRTGKTVMACHAVCKLGQKTLIVAKQLEWLDNFHETFIGGPESEAFTDISKSRIGFARTVEQFEKYDVALATYQSFLSDRGKEVLRKIRSMFNVLIVDECFTYGHRVKTDKGLVSIGDIATGVVKVATVLSRNHATGINEMRPVESVTAKKTKRLCRVAIDGHQFICTPDHKFWSEDRQAYVKAQDLSKDEKVLTHK